MDPQRLRVAMAGVATVLLASGVVAIDARADDGSAAPAASTTSLLLAIGPQQGTGHSVTLTCAPDGGTHPAAKDACAALTAAGGDIGKVTPAQEMCPHLVRPVTATATGTYQGHPVSWSKTFNNTCEMQRATHPLFEF
jgi:hypothetical protein